MTDFQHPAEQGAEAEDFLNSKAPFPTYQYSVFLNGDRDEQLVLRAATFEQLLAGKRNLNQILKKVSSNTNGNGGETKNQEACDHASVRVMTVKKDSPNKGKQFKACNECDAFLGFV